MYRAIPCVSGPLWTFNGAAVLDRGVTRPAADWSRPPRPCPPFNGAAVLDRGVTLEVFTALNSEFNPFNGAAVLDRGVTWHTRKYYGMFLGFLQRGRGIRPRSYPNLGNMESVGIDGLQRGRGIRPRSYVQDMGVMFPVSVAFNGAAVLDRGVTSQRSSYPISLHVPFNGAAVLDRGVTLLPSGQAWREFPVFLREPLKIPTTSNLFIPCILQQLLSYQEKSACANPPGKSPSL